MADVLKLLSECERQKARSGKSNCTAWSLIFHNLAFPIVRNDLASLMDFLIPG